MALTLSHGQADVERGFSVNKQILTNRTLLGEKALHATRTIKEVISKHGSVRAIPITASLLSAYRNAHRLYKIDLEQQKTAERKDSSILGKRKAPINDTLRDAQVKKQEWEEKQRQAEKLISEGTERLEIALSSGQVMNAIPAQALLQSGNKLLKDCRHELELINQVLAGSHHEPKKTAAASRSTNDH